MGKTTQPFYSVRCARLLGWRVRCRSTWLLRPDYLSKTDAATNIKHHCHYVLHLVVAVSYPEAIKYKSPLNVQSLRRIVARVQPNTNTDHPRTTCNFFLGAVQ